MTPVYFPYTYLPDSIRTAVLRLFDGIIIYKPLSSEAPDKEMAPSVKGLVEEKLPLIKYNGMIEKSFNDYLNWAEYHEKGQLLNFKSQMDAIPFFNESSPFKIKSEITTPRESKKDQQFEPDFTSGLFLMYAEYLDKRNAEINSGLQSIQAKTSEMLKELKGAAPLFNETDILKNDAFDPFVYMIKERLNAWASLMIQDIPESCLFLTARHEVVSTLFDEMEGVDSLFDYSGIPLHEDQNSDTENWQKKFHAYIKSMAVQTDQSTGYDLPPPPVSGKGKNCFSFTLYKIRGIAPVDFFSRFSNRFQYSPEKMEIKSNYMNTLMGVIHF